MTQYARLALQDARAALDELRAGPTGLVWRVRWAAAVALLRSVGHVLDKVDGTRNAAMAAAVRAKFAALKATRPEPVIFWEFIDAERNNLLKEYRTAAKQNVTIRPGTLHLNLRTGEQSSTPGLPALYEHVMSEGPFEGQDPRDVVAKAIEWWVSYLDEVDKAAT
jgi:hypothetical protein